MGPKNPTPNNVERIAGIWDGWDLGSALTTY